MNTNILEKCRQGANNSLLRTGEFGVRRLTTLCIVCHYSSWHQSLSVLLGNSLKSVWTWCQRMDTQMVVADGRCWTPECMLSRNLLWSASVLSNAKLTLTKISSVLRCLFWRRKVLHVGRPSPHYRNINFSFPFRGYKFTQLKLRKEHWKFSKLVKTLTCRPQRSF